MNLCLYFVWFVICNIWIIHIPPIAERLNGAEGGSHGAGDGRDFAPSIVYIFYHFGAGAVNKADNIALQIYNITVSFAIELHDGRAVLGVIVAPSKARLRGSDSKSPPETSASRREKHWA